MLFVIATLVGGSAIQAFLPACGTVVTIGAATLQDPICDPKWIYLATAVVALVAVITEITLVSRDNSGRRCPACNSEVPTGQTRCEVCEHDFAAARRAAG